MSYQRVMISRLGGSNVLRVVEEESLPEPGPGEVRIRVLASGVAFTDVMIRKGMYPDLKRKPPFTPGYDVVGVVDKPGLGATRFKVGQRVADLTIIGAHADYVCLPEKRLVPVPKGLDPVESSCLVLSYVTAYQMLRRIAHVEAGGRILVHGAAGAVGTAILQLGRRMGLEMYGTASLAKHDVVLREGAIPIDYRSEDFVGRIRELTGEGVDAVFDPIGGSNFRRSFGVLRPGGTLVAYGFYNVVVGRGGSIPLDLLRLKWWDILPNKRRACFYSIGALREKRPDWFSEDLSELFDLLGQGVINPVISARVTLAEVGKAHEMIERAATRGKIVVDLTEAAG